MSELVGQRGMMEATSQQLNSQTSPTKHEVFGNIVHALQQAALTTGDRPQVLSRIGSALMSSPAVACVFLFNLPTNPTEQLDASVLATRYPNIPNSLSQWATQLALRCSTMARLQLDAAVDQDGGETQMVAVPIDIASPDEVLVVFFAGPLVPGDAHLGLVQSAAHGIHRWDSQQITRQSHQNSQGIAAINDLVTRIQNSESPHDACQRLVDELLKYIAHGDYKYHHHTDGAEQTSTVNSPSRLEVYLGLSDRQGTISLSAISGATAIAEDSELRQRIEPALRECACRNRISYWPPPSNDRHALLCHRQVAQHYDQASLVSFPLQDAQGDLQGVLLVRSAEKLKHQAQKFLSAATLPIASSLKLIQRTQKSTIARFAENTLQAFRQQKTKSIAKMVAIVVGLLMIPMPYNVKSTCEVNPSAVRFIAAPFDGQLKECHVEPGDLLHQQDLLACMDEKEIALELAQTQADLHRAMKLRDGHVATHQSGEARVAFFEAERLRARQELLSQRMQNLELRSPVDGVVIAGDLKQAEGMPLEIGQSLFEIAPLDQLELELAIPEDDVRYIQPGQSVSVRLDAFPFQRFNGTINRVHPAAEVQDHENVFIATVGLANDHGKLRPGMRGHAKTKTFWRPIAWNWLHKPAAKGLRWFGW